MRTGSKSTNKLTRRGSVPHQYGHESCLYRRSGFGFGCVTKIPSQGEALPFRGKLFDRS